MVAEEVGDDEEAEDSDEHDGVGSGSTAHVADGDAKHDENGHDMHVDSKDAIGGLSVVVEATVGGQELHISGAITVGFVRQGHICQSFIPDQVEEVSATAAIIVPSSFVVNRILILLLIYCGDFVLACLIRLYQVKNTNRKSRMRSMK